MATTSGGQLGVGSHRPCIKIPSGATMVMSDPKLAQSGLFLARSILFDLCRSIRVNPSLFSSNNHHGHLRRSVRSREPPTLPQNSIRSHHGDVRPETCAVGLEISSGVYLCYSGLFKPKQPKLDPPTVQPNFLQSHPISRD
ncbi:hypothetical protein CDL15_Pgr023582 [Punica granatum]|uniref:Uncharacterized protein n=1 Tax=Punica granatum TaxID=22663 RepID=A0A218W6W8_PUNGR|nr:hypothetical protein CDL15_Pgr023582 [Punica granatum]